MSHGYVSLPEGHPERIFFGGVPPALLGVEQPEARRSFPNRPSPKTCWMGGATKDVKLKGFKDVAEDREF